MESVAPSARRLSRVVLPKSFVIQNPPLFVLLPAPLARLRTQTSCIRDPNSILVFFHSLSYLTCPSPIPVKDQNKKFDLKYFFFITDHGREYLKLRAELLQESNPD